MELFGQERHCKYEGPEQFAHEMLHERQEPFARYFPLAQEVQLSDEPEHVRQELLQVTKELTQIPFVNVWFTSQELQLEARGPVHVKHEVSH